ncbi:MAG: HAD family hydrolase [Bacteroidaceae bacterium]|nr:HAD family hydrolase [Bacteroidaceae bacterium]
MNNIKGIILDYGGTLDTDGVHWFHIFREVYAAHLPQVNEEQLREAYVYGERYLATHRVIEPTDDFLAMLQKKVRIQLTVLETGNEALAAAIATQCDERVRTHLIQTRQVLDALTARYPLVLVSNFYGNIHSVLRSYGLDGYFKEIVESAVVGIRKPDPQIFALGVEALGLQPSEVLVVGDSYGKDIAPAHSLGCHTVWVKGKGWEKKEESNDTSCADAVITALPQMLDII